ncbi:restriction endonuclease subunit S [Tenacibaculum dicentrarchi]|nr:restriction endonuclease subunit S [Tenacibaculum dicentrarchi]MCD8452647.1 restriction endonuclease subunit S [Tenacibaculum dicentrarchi]
MSLENKIPNGWVETTLGEVCDITSSKRIFAKEYQTSGIPFFRGKEITEKFKGNNISTELFITDEKYNEIKKKYGVPNENDILLTSVGTLGNPYLVEANLKFYFKDGNLTWFKNFRKVNQKFIFYWIVSPQGKENLSHAKIGSTQQAYTMSLLKMIDIIIPPLQEQVAIAKTLTAFDDKIENLQAQNNTLETTAQTIFKEWFGKYQIGDELPEGWREYELGEVTSISAGGDKPKNSTKHKTIDNKIPIYSNGITNDGLYGFTDTPKIFKESITVSARGTIGFVCLRFEPYLAIVRLISITPIQDYLSSKYLFFSLKNQTINGFGTTQQQLTVPVFKKTKIIVPSTKLMNNFTEKVNSFYNKIQVNKSQIETLKKTRDTLLPKLMNGELRVKI